MGLLDFHLCLLGLAHLRPWIWRDLLQRKRRRGRRWRRKGRGLNWGCTADNEYSLQDSQFPPILSKSLKFQAGFNWRSTKTKAFDFYYTLLYSVVQWVPKNEEKMSNQIMIQECVDTTSKTILKGLRNWNFAWNFQVFCLDELSRNF